MNRRELIKSSIGLSVGSIASAIPNERTEVRDLGVGGDGWPHEFDAWLRPQTIINGEDLSRRCFRTIVHGDGKVTALCYKWRDGHPYLEGEDVAREVITGTGVVNWVHDDRRCRWKHKRCVGVVKGRAVVVEEPCCTSDYHPNGV